MRPAIGLLLLLLTWVGPAQAVIYYADKNSLGGACSDSNTGNVITAPKCTISNKIPSLQPGDTLYVRAGTYNESLTSNVFQWASGTSWSAPVTVSAYPGETVTLTPGPNGELLGFVSGCGEPPVTEIRYIVINGFRMDQQGGYNRIGSCGSGVHHIRWSNNEIFNGAGQGIHGLGTDAEVIGNNIHDNGESFFEHGIYWCDLGTIVRDNDIHHNVGYGLHYFCEPPSAIPGDSRVQIFNNRIHDNGWGVTLNSRGNLQFFNNLVYNNDIAGVEVVRGADSAKVFNNTIVGNTSAFYMHGWPSNTEWRNNIAYGNTVVVDIPAGQESGTIYGSNLCSSAALGCQVIGEPLFTNAGAADFTLQAASTARNAGATLALVTTDFAGVARPQGPAYDVGAYEFVEGGGEPVSGNPIYVSAGGHGDTPSDSNSCTVAETITTPKATLASALGCMTVAGKVLYVRGGTYSEVIDTGVHAITGGTDWGTATRIEGYASEVVTLALPVGQSVVLFVRTGTDHYLHFDKLILDAMNRAGSNGVGILNGAHHIRLHNSRIQNTVSGFETVYIANGHQIELRNNQLLNSGLHGLTVDGPSTDLVLEENTVAGHPQRGLNLHGDSGSGTNMLVRGNIIHHTGQSVAAPAVLLGGSTGALVTNNILHNNAAGVHVLTGASGPKLYHNTVSLNTGVGLQCDAGATGVLFTNNISYGNGTDAIVNNCGATLATNLTTNPLFVNAVAGDFHLADGSPGINQGTFLPSVPTAIDGTPRPQGPNVDIGAYERDQSGVTGPDVTVRGANLGQATMLY